MARLYEYNRTGNPVQSGNDLTNILVGYGLSVANDAVTVAGKVLVIRIVPWQCMSTEERWTRGHIDGGHW